MNTSKPVNTSEPAHIRYPATADGLTAALAALGDDTEALADHLDQWGHAGYITEAADCPLARYLNSVMDTVAPAVVGDTTAALLLDTGRIEVDLPDPTRRFVALFVEGGYPELTLGLHDA